MPRRKTANQEVLLMPRGQTYPGGRCEQWEQAVYSLEVGKSSPACRVHKAKLLTARFARCVIKFMWTPCGDLRWFSVLLLLNYLTRSNQRMNPVPSTLQPIRSSILPQLPFLHCYSDVSSHDPSEILASPTFLFQFSAFTSPTSR